MVWHLIKFLYYYYHYHYHYHCHCHCHCHLAVSVNKKDRKLFLLGISVWEECVHLSQVRLEGAEGGLAAKGMELVKKTRNLEHKFQLGSFHRESWTAFSGIPFISENFQRNEPTKWCSIYIPTEISGYRNTSGSLGERETLCFHSFFEFSRVFL